MGISEFSKKVFSINFYFLFYDLQSCSKHAQISGLLTFFSNLNFCRWLLQNPVRIPMEIQLLIIYSSLVSVYSSFARKHRRYSLNFGAGQPYYFEKLQINFNNVSENKLAKGLMSEFFGSATGRNCIHYYCFGNFYL